MIADFLFKDTTPQLAGEDLVLRGPRRSDFAAWKSLRAESHDFLRPFEPRWSLGDLTSPAFNRRLRRSVRLARQHSEFSFFIFLNEGNRELLVGGLTLSNVRLRVTKHANLGYWMGERYARRGIMTRAVSLILPFAFDELKLQRVHAACLPHNLASSRVLEKNGFNREGFADHYLKIDGQWRDHALYGLSRERFEQARGDKHGVRA